MPDQPGKSSRRKAQAVNLDTIGLEMGNKPPQALEVEEAVLGAMLIEPSSVDMALEELSVGLACERITDEGKKKLITAGVEFKEAINSKLVPAIVEKDEKFHDVIFEASENQRLISMAMNLREKVYRYRFEYVKVFSYHDKLITEHDEITRAILRGDKEAAQSVMRKHIYDQEQIVIQNTLLENR